MNESDPERLEQEDEASEAGEERKLATELESPIIEPDAGPLPAEPQPVASEREAKRAPIRSPAGSVPVLRVDRREGQDEVEEAPVSPATRLGRFASGAFAAVTGAREAAAASGGWPARLAGLRRFVLPLAVLAFLIILTTLFKEILLPFVLALVIVYLMEPIVSRLGRTPQDPTGLPRWSAVILVYLVFFGLITTALVLFTPKFISEVVRFSETVPREIQTFRSQQLPDLNRQLKGVVVTYLPSAGDDEETRLAALRAQQLIQARELVGRARVSAAALATAQGEARRVVGLATQVEFAREVAGGALWQEVSYRPVIEEGVKLELAQRAPMARSGAWMYPEREPRAAMRVVPDRDSGGVKIFLEDVELDLSPMSGGGWRVRPARTKVAPRVAAGEGETLQSMFDLERAMDEVIEGFATSSNAKLTSLLTFAQEIVVGVIQAFVALILTLMVAAFISIDLHALMAFFRGLIPEEHHANYDQLLGELDRGLSGVVRGQLTICLVNGVLTYVGLAFLGIKFSLLLGVVAGALSLIPIFGTIISTVPIVLFGLTSGLMTGVFALIWILFIHFVEANILNPKIIGTSAHIHPVIVIFALLAGESAFGLLGALLAVPTASILLTLFRFFLMRSEQGKAAVTQAEAVVQKEGSLGVTGHGIEGEASKRS